MIISTLTLAVRTFTAHAPSNIIFNVFAVHTKKRVVEYWNTFTQDNHIENLDGMRKFTVYPDRIAIDFPQGTLWLTPTGMEW